jgi:hypothetical protein
MTRALLTLACVSLLAGCADAPPVVTPRADVAASMAAARPAGAGLVRRLIPAEDPGPPFYARVGLQILESDGYVAIPFYRSPALVPAAFNLLTFYDFPGPSGPGAFAAPLLPTGFLLTEADAPLGTFPRQVELRGAGVPVWFVPSTAFHAAAQDGVLTIAELRSLVRCTAPPRITTRRCTPARASTRSSSRRAARWPTVVASTSGGARERFAPPHPDRVPLSGWP